MSWKKVKLKEVLKQYRIQHIVQDDVEYKQVTISKYEGVTYRGTKIGKDIGRKRQFVIDLKTYPNTLMMVRQGVQDGSIGIAPAEVDGCIATENMPMFSVEGIDLEYLRFLLKSPYFYDELNKIETTGSAQKSIHERQILEIKIPLPNLEEQKQFVEELTKLKNGGLDISSELTNQLNLIKQLRQSFLREAMQGKLVSNDTKDGKTGAKLLAEIQAEKEKLIKEKKIKKSKPLSPISEEEILFEIPAHWALTTIENIAANEKNALKAGPFGSSLKKEFYVKRGYKIYGQEQVISNNPFFGNYYIDENRFETLKSCEVKTGDVLISLVGTMGKVLILPEGIEKGIINPRLVKVSLYKDINRDFFKYYLYSEIAIKQINHLSHGSTMSIINLSIIKKLIFPLPPLQEQEQIVSKLDELMRFCDGLEQSIKESQGYNEMLLQQVLREALQPKEKVVVLPLVAEDREEYKVSKEQRKICDNGDMTILAGYIIKKLSTSNPKDFGRVKLQKMLHLAEYYCNLETELHYKQKVAGPYAWELENAIEPKLKTYRFFDIKQDKFSLYNKVTYTALANAKELDFLFQKQFAEISANINSLLDKFKNKSWEFCEMISTMYAVWNNRILKNQNINSEELKKDFLAWDEKKIKYQDQLDYAIEWMKKENLVPIGFGAYIEK